MKYLKELTEDTTYDTWNVNVGKGWGDCRPIILEFLDKLKEVECSKKIYWVTPGTMKHLIEHYAISVGKSVYVCRDKTCALAIACGFPVDLKENPKDNLIGVYLSRSKWQNLWYNISNNQATDFDIAANSRWDVYGINLFKKEHNL